MNGQQSKDARIPRLRSPRLRSGRTGGKTSLQRRAAIRRLIRTRPVPTQEALGELLTKEGYQVTQATLSRDLALLRAVRIQGEEGRLRYELQEGLSPQGAQVLPELAEMVVSIEENGTLVVVLTQPGAAPALARAIDVARLPDVLGSLAGDDTIFLAPQKRSSAIQLAHKLRRLFGRVET